MSLTPLVQPREEDLYYGDDEAEPDTLTTAANVLDTLRLVRSMAPHFFAPGADQTLANTHLSEAIAALDRAGVRA